jgi:hypothetical protein
MLRRMWVLGLALPLLAASGCADNSALESEIASLKRQVNVLQESQDRPETRAPEVRNDRDGYRHLELRLEETQRDLDAAMQRIHELEQRPATGTAGDGESALANSDAELIRAEVERLNREREAAEAALAAERRAERDRQQQERMAEMARIAERYELEFDPENPRGSMTRIMRDPEQRNRAMQAMRDMANERRLGGLGLDEHQRSEVERIEAAGRQQIRDAVTNGRERGLTPEQIQQDVQRVRDQQQQDLQRVMTPEQFEQYEAAGGTAGGMIGDPADWLPLLPPGMIPGMPGGDR